MSKEAVETLIGRAVLDAELRKALFANPDEVLAAYDLSDEELTALKGIDAEAMESFASTVDESFSQLPIGPEAALEDYKAAEDRGFEIFSGLSPEEQ